MVKLNSPSVALAEQESLKESVVAAGAYSIKYAEPQAVKPLVAVAK